MAGKEIQHAGISRRNFLKTSAGLGALVATGMYPDLAHASKYEIKKGSLEANLQLLNIWSEKSATSNQLYSTIYKALAVSPEASFANVSKDENFQKICREQGLLHIGGPMLGCLTADGASVWLRTVRPAAVTVSVMIDDAEKVFGPVKSSYESDLSAVVQLSGLPPGKEIPYKVCVDGQEIPTEHARIRTPSKDVKDKTRIAFGTCQHRWGLGNEKNAAMIRQRDPHALLLYGDVAVQDRRRNFAMHRADYALRDFHPAWIKLAAAYPVYASWDDHDYFANDGWGTKNCSDKDRRHIRRVFTHAWNNPYYGLGDEQGGIFQHTRIGPCDVIMTDNRYFREKTGKHCFLGKEQMAWLKKTLLSCKGPFIIMSCGTMWSDFVSNGKDSWGKYDPDGREEIFSLIEKEKIPGVLLISGDRHGARAFKIPRPSGYEFYEFEPASLGGRRGPAATSDKWESQLCGISAKYAFGEFTFDIAKEDPEVTFKLIQEDGTVIYELTLTRSQLTPKG